MDADDYFFWTLEVAVCLMFLFFCYAVVGSLYLAATKRNWNVVVWMPRWYLRLEHQTRPKIVVFCGVLFGAAEVVLFLIGAWAVLGGVLTIVGAKLRGK